MEILHGERFDTVPFLQISSKWSVHYLRVGWTNSCEYHTGISIALYLHKSEASITYVTRVFNTNFVSQFIPYIVISRQLYWRIFEIFVAKRWTPRYKQFQPLPQHFVCCIKSNIHITSKKILAVIICESFLSIRSK